LLGRFGINLEKSVTEIMSKDVFSLKSTMNKIVNYTNISEDKVLVTYVPKLDWSCDLRFKHSKVLIVSWICIWYILHLTRLTYIRCRVYDVNTCTFPDEYATRIPLTWPISSHRGILFMMS
jgi:hypothetical protein